MMKTRHITLGLLTWLCLAFVSVICIRGVFAEKAGGLAGLISGIARWVSGVPAESLATSETELLLAPGDPVFLEVSAGAYRQVGCVRNHFASEAIPSMTRRASIVLYNDDIAAACPEGFVLEYHTTPTVLDWVVKTMLPPARQKEIAKIIADDWQTHRDEIMIRLQPIVEKSLVKTVAAIEAELPAVMTAHRRNFEILGDRYQVEIVRSELVPLVREQILPIIQEEIRPVTMDLGKDLWDRVSLWSFTWRYLYDVSPLPEKNAVKLEFERFIREEVTPALESRSEEFVAVTERIVRRVSRNEKVRSAVRENLRKVATDAELQKIVWSIVQDTIVQNPTLKESLREYWSSAEVREALEVASTRFEPTARAIGNSVFGTRETGVTPEFSRVLRAQILMKDRRWLVAVSKSRHPLPEAASVATDIVMIPAGASMPYPIEFEGNLQSPLTSLEEPSPTAP